MINPNKQHLTTKRVQSPRITKDCVNCRCALIRNSRILVAQEDLKVDYIHIHLTLSSRHNQHRSIRYT